MGKPSGAESRAAGLTRGGGGGVYSTCPGVQKEILVYTVCGGVRMKRSVFTALLMAALMLGAVPFAAAQSFTGSILGTVSDATGAMVPQVLITVTNIATNTRTEVRSDTGGNYIAPLLPPGEYTVELEAVGFKKFVRRGIVLRVQQQARVDVLLELGALTESLSITADAPLLEGTTSSVGKVVENRAIMSLPLNSRNVYSLIFLTPGVSGSIGDNYNSLSYSVNGARSSMMDTIVDGVTASHPTVQGYSGISVFPSVDAIAEFKVQASNYSAEFGRSAGSVLNVIYKSGTNEIHGSAFEFLRNSVLDANNFFANKLGQTLASFKRSQFGGMISGPIKRDKSFFMFSYEGLRQRNFSSSTSTVPTALERQGDFSKTFASNGQMIRIFDPFTTGRNPDGAGYIRDALPDNRLPAPRFDPVAVNVMKYFPMPNTAGNPVTNQNNFYSAGSRSLNNDNYDVRVDHNLSSRQRFFARYSHRHVLDVPAILVPRDIAIAEGRVNPENRMRNAVADYTNTLSPTTILTARLGFARSGYFHNNQSLGFLRTTLGLPKDLEVWADQPLFPIFALSGYKTLGGGNHRWNTFMSYSALANVTRIQGPHSLKFGFEGRMIRVNNREAEEGMFNFTSGFTQGPDPNRASSTAGNSLASFLLGTGSYGNFIQSYKNVATQSFYLGWYVQDDWRFTRKLTLNLGLRYDFDVPRTERFNRMNYFDPFALSPLAARVPQFANLRGGVVFVGVDGRSRSQFPLDRNNLAPRLGLAYQASRRTVIRAGFARMFAPSNHAAHGTVGNNGFKTENEWITSLDGITPFNLLRNPFPQGFRPNPGASLGLLTETGGMLWVDMRDQLTPSSLQWNLTIQRELPSQLMLEAAYVGTRGFHLSRNGESGLTLNQLRPEDMSLGSRLNELVDNPFYEAVGRGVLVGPKMSRAQLLRPYPQFTDIVPLYSSGSSSTYHALQVSASKRLSHGLQFDGSYAWSKMIETGMTHQDSYNIAASRALASIDIAHRLVMSYIYDLPFGRGRHFGADVSGLLNTLLGGWQVNGITIFQSGAPLALSANNTAGIFSYKTRPNNNGRSGKLEGPVHQRLTRYFDTSVFSQPLPFVFGNVAERLPDIRGDITRNFDLSVFKQFSPVERLRIQFRAEFLNAFNTPRFGNPNLSVTSSSFGVISSQANAPRQIQFGLKFLW